MIITPDANFWKVFCPTPGALSTAEAVAIMNVCKDAPSGVYVECGTHKGKSALAACFALKKGTFILVDPIFEDDEICSNLSRTFSAYPSLHIEKKLEADISTNVLNQFGWDSISYCMVDSGSHGDGLPMQEAKLLEDKMVKGGVIGWHDWNSQFHEVRQAVDYLVGTGKYEYMHIDWAEIVAYCEENDTENGNDSWHHRELKHPQFFAAIKRK